MKLDLINKTKKPVLICGETGTGKSYLANHIHKLSGEHKFIHLNINSINKNLFESELFGHERGAFTGAINKKIGFCESVGFGNLFIDEIGDLSLELQSKVLTLIDEGIYYPVGSTEAKKFKGRLIFATNKNLEKLVLNNEFRKDLYFRLRFLLIEQEPLRKKDNLFEIIMNKAQEFQLLFGKSLHFSSEVIEVLNSYSWPGNFRELHNTVEYLFLLDKLKVEIVDLPKWLFEQRTDEIVSNNYYDALSDFEMRFLKKSLKKYNGKINLTAQSIGISKVTLISKLKKYDIDRRVYKNLESFTDTAYGF